MVNSKGRSKLSAYLLLILILFLIPIIPPNLSSRTLESSTNPHIPSLAKPQAWDPAGDFYKGLNRLIASGNHYGYWLSSNMPNVYASTTFGATSTGSTTYETKNYGDSTQETTGSSVPNTNLLYTIGSFTLSSPSTIQSITIYTMAESTAAHWHLGIYANSGGSPSGQSLKVDSGQISKPTTAGWHTFTLPSTYLASGTYWMAIISDTTPTGIETVYKPSGTTYYKSGVSYGALPSTFPTSLSTFTRTWSAYVTGVQIEGYTKGTRVQYIDTTGGIVSDFYFYTHTGGSSDHFTLALYDDVGGSPYHRLWYSGSIGTANSTWNHVTKASGTVDNGWSGTLTNNAYYWFMWQWDATASGPSYTAGSGSTGIFLAQDYGTLQSTWSGGTLSIENWSMYLAYGPPTTTLTSTTSSSSTSTSWVSQPCTYLIYTDGTTVYMQNCKTGGILYSSTLAYLVFDKALSNLGAGGTLLTRAGVYVISNTIYGRWLSNVTWTGDGWDTVLRAGSNIVDTASSYQCGGDYHIDLICIYGGTGVTVSNMQFDGNAVNQSGAGVSPAYLGIEAQYASHITFDHLNVHDFKTDGMQFAGTSDSVMMNNYVANNRADGIMETSWTPPYYAARNTITGNTVTSSSDVGISIYGLDTLVEGNTIVNMNTNNSPFQGTAHVPILIGDDVNASRIVVRNNDIENNSQPGWAIQSAPSDTGKGNYGVTIDGNRIVNCAAGINVVYTQGVTISNNVIQTTTDPNVPYGGIKVYTGATGISVTENLISDSASYGILIQADQANISGNTVTMTNRAASGQTAINIMANNGETSNNTVDLSSVTKWMTGILLSPGYYSNVVSGNFVAGNPNNLLGSGITMGGIKNAILDNQIGGFSVCINTSGTPDEGLITNNVLSSSQCATKINAYGTSMIITGNTGYNPLGHITNPFDNSLNTIKDSYSSAIPNNATTMTVNYSPKIIKVVIGTGWTSAHRLVIKIDGTQVVSTTTPAANTVYSFTLNPAETFYIQYQAGQASFIVSGQ